MLPSLLLLAGPSWVYLRFGDALLVAALFCGIKPAVTALVLLRYRRGVLPVLGGCALAGLLWRRLGS